MHALRLIAWAAVAAVISFHGYRFAHLPDPFSPDFDAEAIAASEANFQQYQRVILATIGPRPQLEQMLGRALDRSPSFDDLDQKVRSLFIDFYVDLLEYCRSQNYDEYRNQWPGAIHADLDPVSEANVRYFFRRWLETPYPTDASASDLARQMIGFESGYQDGASQILACSFDVGGFLAKKLDIDSITQPRDAWLQKLTDEQQRYWLGSVVKSSNILQRPNVSLESLLQLNESVIWIDVFTIAMTRDSDLFPLRIRCWYHPANDAFVLAAADQQSSIIAAQKPPMTF